MSFFDKLKKLFAESPEPKAEKPVEKVVISIEGLSEKVESLVEGVEAKNKKLKEEIEGRVSLLDKDMEEAIDVLKSVDLSKKKEYERVKLIVQSNLETYVDNIRKFLGDLKKIDEKELADYFNRIFLVINEFGRTSHMPYEKATYLIGQEMAETRTFVRQFGQDISAIAEQNKPFFEETQKIRKLASLNKELEESKRLRGDIDGEILNLNKRIEKIGDEIKNFGDEIDDIKGSKEYKEDGEGKQKLLRAQEDLDKELQEIKQKINFKALSNVFHSDKKKAQLIKDYLTNFKAALRGDENLKIVEMANDANQITDLSPLMELRDLIRQQDSASIGKAEKKIIDIEDKIKGLETERATAEASIAEENKKLVKFAKKHDEIIAEIKGVLDGMNVDLI